MFLTVVVSSLLCVRADSGQTGVAAGMALPNCYPAAAVFVLHPTQGGTYGGNAVACAAAAATIDVINNERLTDNAQERGQQLREGMQPLHFRPWDMLTFRAAFALGMRKRCT